MTTSRLMLFAAATCLALAGCETRTKKTETNKPETAGEAADEAAAKTREAADTTVAAAEEVGENTAEVTRDAADDTLNETERLEEKIAKGETLPPEPGVDMPDKGTETPDPADKDDKDVTAEMPPELIGTAVTARFDRKLDRILVLQVAKNADEIDLQSGHELKVSFADLKLLTGMEPAEAIKVIQDAGEIEVRVLGSGNAMRVVDIAMPDDKTEKHDEMKMEKDGAPGY